MGILALRGEHGRLSLFVANDTVANHYYRFSSRTSRSMEDVAPLYGLAFNGVGKAEGCMGVAAADCNSDGFQDLYISNFLHESNTLYCGSESGLFHDRTQEYGLASPSLPVLGFGTQFLDADLDGQQELFLVNGYTHDLTRNGVPFAMPPHFYNWNGSGFHQLPLEQINLGEINSIVGRAVTRLDWNMDQLPDLVVGRIDGPSLLLTNTTKVENRSGVSFELVAKNTARDAIGTLVVVEMGAETRQYQLTSGDGYQCSNQKFIHVGCGSQSSIDKLRVIWPNEKTQEFFDVEVGQYYTIIEGSGIFPVTLTAR